MMNNKNNNELEKLRQEMRRGVIVLATLSQLEKAEYGYSLIKELNEKGFEVGQDTLYPLLRRLEKQELLDSEWRVEDPRPRRYYELNETGRELLKELKAAWTEQVKIIKEIIQ